MKKRKFKADISREEKIQAGLLSLEIIDLFEKKDIDPKIGMVACVLCIEAYHEGERREKENESVN